jgi:hypothetical protein
MILAGFLLVWASSGETAPPTNANLNSLASNPGLSEAQAGLRSNLTALEKPGTRTTSNADNRTLAVSRPATSQSLTTERARQMATAVFGDSIAEVQVLRTRSGPALAAIYAKPSGGTKQFLVMERRGTTFHISSRGPLDKPDFHHAQWVAETLDADNDGYDDVLFTGTDYGPNTPGYRLVLYIPKTGESYCLRAMGSGRVGMPLKVTWSRNALTKQASIYRNVLRDRANSAIVDAISRIRRR